MLKKLIASGSIAVIALSQIASGLVSGAPAVTDPELLDAVAWASDAGLTKYSDASAFMPTNNLTREQFAKFASQFAASQLNMSADVSKTPSFSDTAAADATLLPSITLAYQQGIMLGSNGTFMPKSLVTRGQVAIVVSRMIGAIDPMSSEQDHFNYLKSQGIMNVANLSSAITRGDALLMLYRLANTNSSDLCAIDPALPGCSNTNTGGNNTGVVIPPVVKAGDLQVSMNPSSPAEYSSVPYVGTVKFASVDFTAGSKDVTLYGVELKRAGLGQSSDISRVYLENAGVRVSSRGAVASDDKVSLSMLSPIVVKAGTTETLDILVELNASSAGGEHKFVSTSLNTSAATVNGSIATPTLRTANYNVASVNVATAGAGSTWKANDSMIEIGQFKLQNNGSTGGTTKDVLFKAITLRQLSGGDLVNLDNIYLERDGQKVSTSTILNGKDLTFSLGNGDTIKDGNVATYYVRASGVKYVDNSSDGYNLQLRNSTDINVVESTTSFRTAITPTSSVTLSVYTVQGADVKFAKDASFDLAPQYAVGTPSVIIMKGTISAKQQVTLEDISLGYTASTGVAKIAKRYYLQIGNSTFTWSPSVSAAAAGTATFDGSITFAGDAQVTLWADIDTTAPSASTVTFNSLQLGSFSRAEYTSTQNTITSSVGSIQAATVTVVGSKLNVTRNDGISATKTVVKDSKGILVYGAELSNTQSNKIRISSIIFQNSNAGFNAGTDVTLYVAGQALSTKTVSSSAVTFNGLNIEVVKGAPVSFTVQADLSSVATGTAGYFYIPVSGIGATDVVTSNSVSNANQLNGATISVVDSGKLTISQNAGTLGASILYGGQKAVKVSTFDVAATNDGIKLTDLYVQTVVGSADLNRFSNIKLVNGSNTVAVGVVEGTGLVKFESISSNNQIDASKTNSYSIVLDVSDVVNSTDVTNNTVKFALDTVSANWAAGTVGGVRATSSSNGAVITSVVDNTVGALSKTHKIARAAIVVSDAAATPTSTDVASFNVSAYGYKAQLTGLSYTFSNVSGATSVQVYKDSVSAGNLVYSGAYAASTTINFTAPVEVAQGGTTKLIVRMQGYTPTVAGNSFLKRSFALSNVLYVDYFDDTAYANAAYTDASSYINVGTFPMNYEYQP